MNGPPEVPQPRCFWRRLLAVIVDWSLISGITTLLLLPVLRPDETALRLSDGPLTFTTCQVVTDISPKFADTLGLEKIDHAKRCEVRPFGIYNGTTLELVYDVTQSKSGAVSRTSSRNLVLPIDQNGNVVAPFVPQKLLVPFLMMILSAIFLARGRRSLGKWLAGIRIIGEGCPICRELRRLGPFVLVGGAAVVLGLVHDTLIARFAYVPIWWVIAGQVAVTAVFGWLYFWPLVRWHGVMPYDRATGFKVVRA